MDQIVFNRTFGSLVNRLMMSKLSFKHSTRVFCTKLAFTFLATVLFFVPAAAEGEVTGVGTRATISGYVKDAENGEALIGVTVFVQELKTGTSTNNYGFYSISLQPGIYKISFSYFGYGSVTKEVDLKANVSINIDLGPIQKTLEEVVVSSQKADVNVRQAEMSVNRLDMKAIKKIPALMGEIDVIKAIQLLPGVLPTAEGTSGFSVRGGNNDQNLIVLDEATVYNASHLMGFFSVFNNDAISDVKLYKGDIPTVYGGRLSSVLEVRMKEGNNKKFSATGGIGLISSRLTLEGPIVNQNTSFLVSGRRTYADLFFPLFPDSGLKKSIMYFYDLNLKINHQLNQNNRLFLSAYGGRDKFGQKGFSDAGFGNQTATFRWNHLFTDKLFSNVTLIYSKYDYAMEMKNGGADYVWNSRLMDYSFKSDFNYFITPGNELKFGISSTYHYFDPCEAYIKGQWNQLTVPYAKTYALEHGAYLWDQFKINDRLSVKAGVRYSVFQNIGKGTVYKFDENYEVIDSIYYPSGKIYNTHQGWEPRVGVIYVINDKSSVKANYSRTVQYMQLASNATGGMPLETWFPSSPNVKPQKADQYALGYFRNFKDNMYETSVEVYYKSMYDVIDFKDHPQLLMNPRMEGEIRVGKAKAYGVEFFVRKNEGRLNGWISYTLSRVKRKISEINQGIEYPSPYDKPHTVNVILSYDISPRVEFSTNWVYATGAPYTAPDGKLYIDNTVNKTYSSRNGVRMRDYHRLDLSVTLKNRTNKKRLWNGEWVFSVYNAYGRHNDWMINFTEDRAKNIGYIKAKRWYLPFLFFPGITYNFHF